MTRRGNVWLGAVFAGAAMTALAAQQGGNRPPTVTSGILVFEDSAFEGRSRTFSADVRDLRGSGFDDRISSVVVASGETWELCVDPDYSGRCMTITDWEINLADIGWNDRISSMRRVRGNRGDLIGPQTLDLFAGTNYSGQRTAITGEVDNFRSINFNDRALSVRPRGGESWEICVNADFDDCRVIDEAVPDLGTIGLARQISSARPRLIGRGRRGFRGGDRQGIVLFSGMNFTGTSIAVDQARSSLGSFNDLARSLRVVSGRWELCDDEYYGGRCLTVTADVSDLRSVRLSERIRSVRPR